MFSVPSHSRVTLGSVPCSRLVPHNETNSIPGKNGLEIKNFTGSEERMHSHKGCTLHRAVFWATLT